MGNQDRQTNQREGRGDRNKLHKMLRDSPAQTSIYSRIMCTLTIDAPLARTNVVVQRVFKAGCPPREETPSLTHSLTNDELRSHLLLTLSLYLHRIALPTFGLAIRARRPLWRGGLLPYSSSISYVVDRFFVRLTVLAVRCHSTHSPPCYSTNQFSMY